MSDTVVDTVDFLKGGSPSPSSKRKREFGDVPDEQRKRSVTTTATTPATSAPMSTTQAATTAAAPTPAIAAPATTTTSTPATTAAAIPTTSGGPLLGTDAPNLSFIESAVEAAAAASSSNIVGMTNAATVAALSALQQATRDANEAHEQASLAMNVEHTHTHSPLTHTQSPLAPTAHTPHTPHQQHAHSHQHHHPEPPADPADPANASSTAAAALGTMYPTIHVPTPTEQQFGQTPAPTAEINVSSAPATHPVSVVPVTPPPPQSTHESAYPDVNVGHVDHTLGLVPRTHSDMCLHHRKPAVGTPEWHKQRKDNHKEVERRRRETINEGINELAKIVPQCEKNKGSILQKAVQFIQQLKANEASNIEKWTLEKLLTEQAIGELSQSNEKLKAECERLYRELETYKRMCQSAGLEIPGKQTEATVPTTTN
ncbi:hypothetical protein BROUX41_000541 [Berkeleyomyces rouxiae]|uniref:uncharacterized protein n=1 Tax=Berkeleyomyces rouxiae TaxID=2035830 RepID=UPI003B7B4D8A